MIPRSVQARHTQRVRAVQDIAALLRVGRATLWRALKV